MKIRLLNVLFKNKRIVCWFAAITIFLLSCKKEEDIVLTVDFTYTVVDSNYAIPAHISFSNQITGASFYK